MVLFSRFLAEFCGNPPLCNTQQGYSPPRRGRIVRRFSENSRDGIGRTVIRKIGIGQRLFPLLGERMKGEGECKKQIPDSH